MKKIGASLALFLVALSLTASDCNGPLEPEPSFEAIFFQNQPVWSPDSSMIVFPYGPDLYSVTSDGTTLKLITSEKHWIGSPDISPDGSKVAYTAFRKGTFWNPGDHWEIKTVNIDGSDKRILGRNDLEGKKHANDINPSWSPDGKRLAFISNRSNRSEESPYHVYTMADDGSNLNRVVSSVAARVDPPQWSPHGEHLAFIAFNDESETYQLAEERYAYVVQLDGSGLTNLGRTWTVPEWSTDGDHLAFVGSDGTGRAIVTVTPDGSVRRNIKGAGGPPPYFSPGEYLSWSPDGAKLLHAQYRMTQVNNRDVYVINLSEPNPSEDVPIATRIGRGFGSWSPDNSRIAMLKYRPYTFYTVLPDGSHYQVLVKKEEEVLISGSEWRTLQDESRQNK